MPEVSALIGFAAAALIVLIIPGPGVLYILTRSLSQGPRAGVVSAAGLSVGALAHVAAATAGLSAILATSATAFGVVKMAGAAYLIYMGVRTIRARPDGAGVPTPAARSSGRLFKDGVLVSVLNPKIAVFFLAFLPQFVGSGSGSIPGQVMFLGLMYAVLAFITDSSYALLAGRLRRWLIGRRGVRAFPRYASGTVYIGLGVGTALADQH